MRPEGRARHGGPDPAAGSPAVSLTALRATAGSPLKCRLLPAQGVAPDVDRGRELARVPGPDLQRDRDETLPLVLRLDRVRADLLGLDQRADHVEVDPGLDLGHADRDVQRVIRDVLPAELQGHEEQFFQVALAVHRHGLGLGVDAREVRAVRPGGLLLEEAEHEESPEPSVAEVARLPPGSNGSLATSAIRGYFTSMSRDSRR